MSEDKIKSALKEAGIEKEIQCPQAFAIAQKIKVSKKAIGDYCNANKIKIRGCQLGCFK
jgi:phage host-nuclease inhibitor protein Gam